MLRRRKLSHTATMTTGATAAHVTYEANQIGHNFACLGQEAAAEATADHIRRFWAPLLRQTLIAEERAHPTAFTPIATAAIARLSSAAPYYSRSR